MKFAELKAQKGLVHGTREYYREWQRWRHNRKPRVVFPDSFWRQVKKESPWDCWLWVGQKNKAGYGMCGQRGLAHRVAYELNRGKIPEGLTLDHLCRVKGCVNPWHLEAVPLAINIARAKAVKTSCVHGHPYSEHGFIRADGARECRTCKRRTQRNWELKQREIRRTKS